MFGLSPSSFCFRGALLTLVAFAGPSALHAGPPTRRLSPGSTSEAKAARAFDAAHGSALQLHAFLERMPKGADLHMHLSGAIYAETFIRDAVADQACINPLTLSLAWDPSGCQKGHLPAAQALTNQKLYDELVDSFSMRGFVPTPGTTGHDQFFSTFGRFSGLKSHDGEWLDEVATRAAAQNEQYLEVMMTPGISRTRELANRIGWPAAAPSRGASGSPASAENAANTDTPDPSYEQSAATREQLAALRDKLLSGGLRDDVVAGRAELKRAFATRDARELCGQPGASASCSVTIRVLYQVLRAFPPQQVFAQTLLGFEIAAADIASGSGPVVGINFVQPEDAYLAMSEYHRQMLMLDYLHSVYPQVHISLHAGELAPGLVPPDGLRFHIREAIDLGHAERIGHGVDVMYEERSADLLKEMAARHIMVEINLTSNDVILGVTSNYHSLPSYRAAGVPVALSTDDEGVSRIDLTHEYTRAAIDYKLSYLDLKAMVRTGLEHTFLPGASLWAAPDVFTTLQPACHTATVGTEQPPAACLDFLRTNPKAAQQWELEHRFQVFESSLP